MLYGKWVNFQLSRDPRDQLLSLLAEAIRKAFNQEVAVLNNCLRIERPEGHAFISKLVDKFPEEIESVTFGKPTLEDVFLHHTGKPWI